MYVQIKLHPTPRKTLHRHHVKVRKEQKDNTSPNTAGNRRTGARDGTELWELGRQTWPQVQMAPAALVFALTPHLEGPGGGQAPRLLTGLPCASPGANTVPGVSAAGQPASVKARSWTRGDAFLQTRHVQPGSGAAKSGQHLPESLQGGKGPSTYSSTTHSPAQLHVGSLLVATM